MIGRAGLWPVLPVWLGVCALLLLAFGQQALALMPADSDDLMRLIQVRDWLAGQSWWDVAQYRMDPPAGVPMHWSRLVDLPIAGVVLIFWPLGRATAEGIALVIVPLATLAVLMALMAALARRLLPGERAAPPLAAAFVGTSFFVVIQLIPGRIDHHGWQLVAAAAAMLGLFDPRAGRGGLVAGVALATGLAISIEGLPFAAALGAAAGLRWVAGDAGDGRRLAMLALTLAGTGFALFAATRPAAAWFGQWCDVVTPGHLAAFAVVGVGGMLGLSSRRVTPPLRLVALALTGAVALGMFLAVSPACAADPFGGLDPLVRRLWYGNVLEGQPIWRQSFSHQVQMLWLPLVGAGGVAVKLRLAIRLQPGENGSNRVDGTTRDWLTLLALLLAATLIGLVVRRAIGTAEMAAIPGAVGLTLALVRRARRIGRPATRTLASVAALLLPTPLAPLYAQAMLQPADAPAGPPTACAMVCALDQVAALPPADMLTPIDLAAPILARTADRVVAGPYHRAPQALGDVIRAYVGSSDVAHAIVRRRRLGYVLIEPGSAEALLYARIAPAGLMARLAAGRAPAWLAPVPVGDGPLRLWRVVG